MVLLDPLRSMKARRNSAETQQSDHTLTCVPEVKDGRSQRCFDREAQTQHHPEGGGQIPLSFRKKNPPSVPSCIDKKTKGGCDRGSEPFTAGEAGNNQRFVR